MGPSFFLTNGLSNKIRVSMLKSSLRRLVGALTTWCAELSYIGAVLAILFFAASLTPSLLPRHYIVQGILSGLATTVGYSVGVFLVWLWHYLGFRDPPAHWQRLGKRLTAIAVTPVTIGYLWRATIWQNSIRSRMAMELLQSAYPIRVVLITLLSSFLLLVFARFIGRIWHYLHERLHHYLPRRVSYVLATCLLALLLFMTANHVVARFALSLADTVFSQIDEVVEEEVPAPTDTLDSGGPESNILWDSIGLQGKHFIALGPQQADIEKFWSQPAKKPLRIYVGLRSRPTPAERAKLALEELIRTGGFERSALIIALQQVPVG